MVERLAGADESIGRGHLCPCGSGKKRRRCCARVQPDAASVLNLGKSLELRGDLPGAIARYRDAAALDPSLAESHCLLGNALIQQESFIEAAVCLNRAISLRPEYLQAIYSLGWALDKAGRLAQSIICYRHAIAIDPGCAEAHNNLGTVLLKLERFEAALESLQQAHAAAPLFTPAISNLLHLHTLLRDVSPEAERALAEQWEKSVLSDRERATARQRAPAGSGAFTVQPLQGRKLRLGIVSADLGDHPVSVFLEPILQQLDKSRFHLTLFNTRLRTGARAERLQALADSFISLIDVPDDQAAERIRAEHIDVLMDASGHTPGNRLGIFAHRAAPVQCSYVGYWSTTGLTEIDWYITDVHCDATIDPHFTEGLWRLPRLAYCYTGDPFLQADNWNPDPDGTIWLGSFNKFSKIRGKTLALWGAVLNAIPETKLLVEDRLADDSENRLRVLSTLSHHGIAEDRVAFISFFPGHDRHMGMYNRLDIALDTTPLNSGTTAYNALWMGVPLVTLEGDWFGGRLTSAVLKTFGREDWIARSTEEYVAIIRSLVDDLSARDIEGRRSLRRNQRALMAASPLCDSEGVTTALETAFEQMYNRWLGASEAPGAPPIVNSIVSHF